MKRFGFVALAALMCGVMMYFDSSLLEALLLAILVLLATPTTYQAVKEWSGLLAFAPPLLWLAAIAVASEQPWILGQPALSGALTVIRVGMLAFLAVAALLAGHYELERRQSYR